MAHTKRAPVDPGGALKRTPRRSAGESTQVPSFDVVLRDVGTGDLNVVKLVQQATGGSLQKARDIVAGDGVVKADVSREEAEAVARRLESAGVAAEVRLHGAEAPWQGPAVAAGGFDVVLRAVGTGDLNVVKRVQQAMGVSLQEARDIVAGDGVVKTDVSREEAAAVAGRLASAGVEVEVRAHAGG